MFDAKIINYTQLELQELLGEGTEQEQIQGGGAEQEAQAPILQSILYYILFDHSESVPIDIH